MESPVSTLHCSFVVYLDQDSVLLPQFLGDLRSFFQKFPLKFELVAALAKKDQASAKILAESRAQDASLFEVRIHENRFSKNRAENLRQALNTCEAPYLLILNPEMSAPLGDSFKVLQHLMSDESLDVCWGERYSKKSGLLAQGATPALKLEDVFNKILKEKNKAASLDSLCEVGGFKLSAWKKLDAGFGKRKLFGWYLHPFLQKEIRELALKREDIFVHDAGQRPRSFSVGRARWNLLRQSIF